jgi:hypothetical protein
VKERPIVLAAAVRLTRVLERMSDAMRENPATTRALLIAFAAFAALSVLALVLRAL